MFEALTEAQRAALKRIASDWLRDCATREPFEDPYFEILQELGLASIASSESADALAN